MPDVDPLSWLAEPLEPTVYENARILLARPELVVPVLGAGVSAGAGQPTSPELAHEMMHWPEASSLPDGVVGSNDARTVADAFIKTGVLASDAVRERAVDYLRARSGKPTALVDRLVHVPSMLIVTLNYDLSVEDAARRLHVPFQSLVLRQHPGDVLPVERVWRCSRENGLLGGLGHSSPVAVRAGRVLG